MLRTKYRGTTLVLELKNPSPHIVNADVRLNLKTSI